jgi:hypothetical protein
VGHQPDRGAPPLVAGGGVLSAEVSADGQFVTYHADQDEDLVVELYTVPIDGSAPPVKVNQALVAGGDTSQARRSPDSRRIAYLADAVADGVSELWLRAADGSSAAVSLTASVGQPGPAPFGYQWSPTGMHIFHRAVHGRPNTTELWATSFCGDGGLSMLLGDIMTVVTYRLPVKLVVFDNGQLGMVKLEMEQVGLPQHGTALDNPDFARVAEAMGMRGIRVEKAHDVDAAVQKALAYDGPVLLDVVTNPNEVAIPPSPTLEQGWGFAIAKMKESVDSAE